MSLVPNCLSKPGSKANLLKFMKLQLLVMHMQEQRQQSMAGYAAELQAQIADKERRKRLQRQNSLRESQDLLAQRMTVPSGLVRLTSLVRACFVRQLQVLLVLCCFYSAWL